MSNISDKLPSIFAVVVGIDEYKEFPPLTSAVADARKIATFLTDRFNVPADNIISLHDSKATKEGIIGALSSLPQRPAIRRNDAILFFFSGYAGQAKSDESDNESPVGLICPADIDEQTGIPDATLVQLFDHISKSLGNNITVFLDCASDIFNWGNPSSFVVITPNRATETEEGGTFTKSLLKVLGSEIERIDSLTVQSLADKVRADMDEIDVHCYGQNVDCVIFNPTAGEAYHAFISGCTLKDGSIELLAGSAHGIQNNATYGIYASNVRADWNTMLGRLVVSSVNDDISATLRFPEDKPFSLPTVFYAVERHCPHQRANIFFPNSSPHITTISSFPSAKEVATIEEANITLKFDQDTALFSWNGISKDRERTLKRENNPDIAVLSMTSETKSVLRIVRKAARFTYHLSRVSPDNSFIIRGLMAQIRAVDVFKEIPTGTSILQDEGLVELKLEQNETLGPYCLILRNDNSFPVWPYVFICDPDGFDIFPWYAPPPGMKDAPLRANNELIVGSGKEEGLLFNWTPGRAFDVSYIKIFVTMERTQFSSLAMQRYTSSAVDSLEDPFETLEEISGDFQSPSVGVQEATPDNTRPRTKVGLRAKWAAMQVTILQRYLVEGV